MGSAVGKPMRHRLGMQKIRVSPIGWKVAFDARTSSVRSKIRERGCSKVLEKHSVNLFA